MNCSQCLKQSFCPCTACNNKGKVLWVWDKTGEIISCGHCGFTRPGDWWEDEEVKNFLPLVKLRE